MTARKKLVRDRIPEMIRAEGRSADVRVLGDEALLAVLIAKLDEERLEFESSPGLEELADVIGSRDELERVREARVAARGGFARRTWLESVD